jgi:uncharacterized protein YdgA (DUF945 family)
VGLAVLILVSPGLIGRLAERSIDENIRVGTVETEGVVVSAQTFQRGWFTTEGEHRIELKDGPMADQYRAALGWPADMPLPALIINTRVDHGVIPVASMGREDGSLRPGLGDAISTLRVEMPDGRIVDVPGVVNSTIGITGSMRSEYRLPAGAVEEGSGYLRWGDGRIEIRTRPSDNRFAFDTELGSVEGSAPLRLAGLTLQGEQTPSPYGFWVGHVNGTVESFSAGGDDIGPLELSMGARIVDEELKVDFAADVVTNSGIVGEARTVLDLSLAGINPRAFGSVLRRYQALVADAAPRETVRAVLEPELRRLVAGGMSLDVAHLDIELPEGRLDSTFDVDIEARDTADEPWSAVLLATRASGSIRMTETLVDMLIAMNPQAGAVVGMGYLKQDGDAFVTEIEYARGILTINGAPMAIPLAVP